MLLLASTVGAVARRLLDQDQEAIVYGNSSRGAFIRLASGWIIFLSRESYPGPLTLNFNSSTDIIESLPAKQIGSIRSGTINFPSSDLLINTIQAYTFSVPALNRAQFLPASNQREMLEHLVREFITVKGDTGMLPILAALVNIRDVKELEDEDQRDHNNLVSLQSGLQNKDLPAILNSAAYFLGRGQGLTPSGDDMIAGMLLALNHGLVDSWQQEILHKLNTALVTLAYRQTTTLCANLIECASTGTADQRLIDAVDSILTGTPAPQEVVPGLSSWGASSGGDALTGITLAVTATKGE